MAYEDQTGLTDAEKEAQNEASKNKQRAWIDVDISGKSVLERVERLEGIVMGRTDPPPP